MLSNEIFVDALTNCGACAVLVSEENEDPIFVPPEKAGRFCVAFDPLDGSSNIDCNVSTGAPTLGRFRRGFHYRLSPVVIITTGYTYIYPPTRTHAHTIKTVCGVCMHVHTHA